MGIISFTLFTALDSKFGPWWALSFFIMAFFSAFILGRKEVDEAIAFIKNLFSKSQDKDKATSINCISKDEIDERKDCPLVIEHMEKLINKQISEKKKEKKENE